MSGRASGRKRVRTGTVVEGVNRDSYDPGPNSGEGDAIGESELTDPAGSPIPGGQNHILNYETKEHPVPTPAPPPAYDGMMAHGVPAEPRSDAAQIAYNRGTGRKAPPPVAEADRQLPPPVPVYEVENPYRASSFRTAQPRNTTVPNNATDPKMICGWNKDRVRVGLLNEDGTTDIRIGWRPSDLASGGGALLVHGQTSYLWIDTQDDIWAVTSSATLTVKLSLIEVYEQES